MENDNSVYGPCTCSCVRVCKHGLPYKLSVCVYKTRHHENYWLTQIRRDVLGLFTQIEMMNKMIIIVIMYTTCTVFRVPLCAHSMLNPGILWNFIRPLSCANKYRLEQSIIYFFLLNLHIYCNNFTSKYLKNTSLQGVVFNMKCD